MTYTIRNLVKSIASQLVGAFPDYPVYDSPTQQGATYPCFFVFLMPSTIVDQIDRHEKRDIAFDIVFVQARNAPNAYAQIHGIADTLDELMDFVNYTADGETVPLHTHEREWSIDDQELHYKLHIKQRVAKPVEHIPMQKEDTNVEVKKNMKPYTRPSGCCGQGFWRGISLILRGRY